MASISSALGTINRALDSLREARELASYDLWFGGLVASARKRDKLRRVEGYVRSARWTLTELRSELEKLDLAPIVDPSSKALIVWGDVWLDNPVSDALSVRRLRRLDSELNRIARELVALQSRLSREGRGDDVGGAQPPQRWPEVE